MKTLVNLVTEVHDGLVKRYDQLFVIEGSLDVDEAEEKLRDALDDFFTRAGESTLKEAWSESCGDFNWGDVLLGYGTDYFAANGIEWVQAGKPSPAFDTNTTVVVNHDEQLFPDSVAKRMETLAEAEEGL